MAAVIAFVSQKGGVGKSTLARALAAVCAQAGLKVLLADLDGQQQTVSHWYQARKNRGAPEPLAVEAFESVHDAIESSADADLLILDAPGGASEETLEIARIADLIVQPSGPSADDLHPTVLLFHELTNAGIPVSRLVVALCRVLSNVEEVAARSYLEKAGYELLAGSIPESIAYRSAQNDGRSLTETGQASFNDRADALMVALLTKVAALADASDDALREDRKGEVA